MTRVTPIATLLLLLPLLASAHIRPSPDTFVAGSSGSVSLKIGHGCDGEATKKIVIQVPESLINVKARPLAGWTISYKTKKLTKPATLYGSSVTTTIDTITYTAGQNNALADNQVQLVDIFFNVRKTAELGTLPGKYKLDAKFGPNGWRPAYIPVTQICTTKQNKWTDIHVPNKPEPEEPAPIIFIREPPATPAAEGFYPAEDARVKATGRKLMEN